MEYSPHFSSLWLALLAVAGGMICLVAGGECLVSGATRLAKRFGMSPLLIGLTVVAFGTSMPELFVSLAASLQNHADLMVGNVVGSNIANIGLVLSLSALMVPIPVTYGDIKRELWLVIGISFVTLGLGFLGQFPRIAGILFVTGLLFFTYYSYHEASRNKKINNENQPAAIQSSLAPLIGMIIGGFVLLAYGSDLFIKGAVDVALHVGISELVIGLTLAAVGTSLPELASSISAARRGHAALLLGNILGSNLFNLMMVMGTAATVSPVSFTSAVSHRDLPIMVGFVLVLVPIVKFRQTILRRHGFFLLSAYAIYMFLLV